MYSLIKRLIFNTTLIPITIISTIIAIPFSLFFLPYGIYYAYTLNNKIQDKLYNSFIILIYGLPFYYCLSFGMIFTIMSENLFNYMDIQYYI